MALIRWDPYRELSSLADRFNRAAGALGTRERDEEMGLGAWIPPVDIAEDKDKIVVTAELPGFKEDEVQIQVEGNLLTIRGERKFEQEKEGKNYHRIERAYGQFVRTFSLPTNVDRENIRARFKNGLLEIEMPKREDARPKQIKISGETSGKEKQPIEVQTR
ncbi:MAG TPA: Hsp20/alpha crystallin family protein [Thermoanaerobaculia bacterium]|nr:Hsp20/alpha crystallin family protein [Thermoanaerobaculia bacterium]